MFDFAKWITDNLIAGVKNGAFPREWAAVQLANYYVKEKISDEELMRFDEETALPAVEEDTDAEQ